MRCARCDSDNEDGRKYCGACGGLLRRPCGACGFANDPGARYCGGCGAPLAEEAVDRPTEGRPVEGERRHVVVLFADLAGYTRLSASMDAESVHALLDRFFAVADAVIDRHGGTVDKHIGDCVMGLFGAPIAHQDDAVRAATAALAMRDSVVAIGVELGTSLALHIGIAAGEVVASPVGGAGHRAYTVTGDAVNLAARLVDRAAAGDVVVSGAVATALGPRFRGESLGAVEIRGLDRPVEAWRLDGLDGTTSDQALPLVGRRAELRQVRAALETCLEGAGGVALLLRGEAGIGKTRLVQEIRAEAERLGLRSHLGLVLDFGAGQGRDAVAGLLLSLLDLQADAATEARQAALDTAIGRGWAVESSRAGLADLLGLPQPPAARALLDAMSEAGRDAARRAAMASVVEGAAAQRPRLLVVEDLHWSDPGTLDHLALWVDLTRRVPLALLLTTRVDGDPLDGQWRARLAQSSLVTLDLAPLRETEARDLAARLASVEGSLIERCVERAAGNPLFLEHLLRHGQELGPATLPGSVQSLVQARLDQLAPADKAALQAASVLGQRFSPAALVAVLGTPDYDPRPLVTRALLRPLDDELLFTHALIRDAVYASLLLPRRRDLHRRAAAWLAGRDAQLHAEHLDLAGEAAAPRAFLAAAREQQRAYHSEAALALAERGLVSARSGADRAALGSLVGEILLDLGRADDALQAYDSGRRRRG